MTASYISSWIQTPAIKMTSAKAGDVEIVRVPEELAEFPVPGGTVALTNPGPQPRLINCAAEA